MVALEVFPALAWADRVAAELAARLVAEPGLRLCLPTGDTPEPVYAALVERVARGEASLADATVVLLDEWVGLRPGDPARGDVQIRTQLLDLLPDPPAAVYLVDVDDPDLDAAVARHDIVAMELDLVLLGLGTNGHVGFNEPGTLPDSPTRIVRLAASSRTTATARYGAASEPAAGVTIGLDRILSAREVWLLVTGEHKAAMLRRALREPEGPDCPASYLQRHGRLRVLVDEAAAALL